MEIPVSQSTSSSPLDYASFDRLREAKLRPSYNIDGLRLLKLQALRERDLRELYRDRAPYELLQNADDAGATKAIFFLTDEGLAFAHDGKWFSVDNFRSLSEGWSDKHPDECIGHKGLGFRSVLDITPAPHIFKVGSKDFFGAKFTWAINKGHIETTLQKDPTLSSDFTALSKYRQPYCPIMSIPGRASQFASKSSTAIHDSLSRGKYGDGFTTMFWFPANDREINHDVLKDLGPKPIISNVDGEKRLVTFIEKEVSVLLPFLSNLLSLKVYSGGIRIAETRLKKETAKRLKDGEIQIITNIDGSDHTVSFYQRSYQTKIPHNILNLPDTPHALKSMESVKITLSVKLTNGKPTSDGSSRFHIYFPTEEFTGMGFTIHGDFFVKPDRTRLMPGEYNKWLLKYAANKAANEFLTQLLDKYEARSVYSALSPTGSAHTDIAKIFCNQFALELKSRQDPFIITQKGFLRQEEVLLPPSIDEEGFWKSNFSEVVSKFDVNKKDFILPDADGIETRYFLGLTNACKIQEHDLFKFIELSCVPVKSAEWWYFCYTYMAENNEISRQPYEYFKDQKIIPCSDSVIRALSDDSGFEICLPPLSENLKRVVPDRFTKVFSFVDYELAKLIDDEKDKVSRWILNTFRIPRFEASELLPRAIRNIAPQMLLGQSRTSFDELSDVWIFIRSIISAARVQPSDPSFWREIGRFPLPLDNVEIIQPTLCPTDLCPAFLAYWPDSLLSEDNCLKMILGLRKTNHQFFEILVSKSNISSDEWINFFDRVGLSRHPKILKYARVIGRKDLYIATDSPQEFENEWFCGERQYDENIAVIHALRKEKHIWRNFIESINHCTHDGAKVLNSLTISEVMGACVEVASKERLANNNYWIDRLQSFMKDVLLNSRDALIPGGIYCYADKGHSYSTPSYLQSQMKYYQWLPSTRGPATSDQCYIRQSSRRLISKGRADEELGDKLIPYLIIDNLDDIASLQRLGLAILEDAASADKSTLIRVLFDLGDILSTDWGKKDVLDSRGRWRLVRGAIQEILSSLNKSDHPLVFPEGIKLPVKSRNTIRFQAGPFYYAEPGSAVEQAFIDTLPIIDADRAYRNLFEMLEISRLDSADIINEEFQAEDSSIPWTKLKEEIVNGLGPYYLALIKTKADRPKHDELVLRRLKERFDVRLAKPLIVSFALKPDLVVEKSIDFPYFYLQRKRIKGAGAIEEFHYVLYVNKDCYPASISLLDADALGAVLSPLFLDGITDDLAAYFPRISSRYQHYKGNSKDMALFLYHQLGVSLESQESAIEKIADDLINIADEISPPPLPVVTGGSEIEPLEKKQKESLQKKHQDRINDKIKGVVNPLFDNRALKEFKDQGGVDMSKDEIDIISPEQEERGKKGEEEIKRRLKRSGGWFGLSLIRDVRQENCGYDFLCKKDEQEILVEVKTFTRNGRVFVTSRELKAAAENGDKYYLVGVLDEDKQNEWSNVQVVIDPIETLLREGEFDAIVKMKIAAHNVFTELFKD